MIPQFLLMHLKLDIKNEITEKYKNLYKSEIDKIDESSKLFLYNNLEPSLERKFYLSFNDFSIRSSVPRINTL
jgi:hypothetical protein